MKLLLIASKVTKKDDVDTAANIIRRATEGRFELKTSNDIDWTKVRENEGGWNGLPPWMARNFDALAVIETDRGGLGRGTYDAAIAFLNAGKPIAVVRGEELKRVTEVVPTGEDDWKTYYGKVIVAG